MRCFRKLVPNFREPQGEIPRARLEGCRSRPGRPCGHRPLRSEPGSCGRRGSRVAWHTNWRHSRRTSGWCCTPRIGRTCWAWPTGTVGDLRRVNHYLGGGRRVIAPAEARALAGALEGTLGNLPPERRRELRPLAWGASGQGPVVGASLSGPGADYEGHFAWQRRWIVEEVVRLCRRGAVGVRPM